MFTIKCVRHIKEFLPWLYTNPRPVVAVDRCKEWWDGTEWGDWELGQKMFILWPKFIRHKNQLKPAMEQF